MRTVLQRIEHALTFCHEYADGCWSIDTEKFRHHVTPELLEDTRQELESMQLKLMSAKAKLAEVPMTTVPNPRVIELYEGTP